jgi:hypothetical protein
MLGAPPAQRREPDMKRLCLGKCILLWLLILTLRIAAVAQVIQISNVEELYSAVNDTANAGATLALAPGTYMVSAIDSYGVQRPKGGRIEFQPDMSIMGVEGDRSLVVINASGLPASSFPTTTNGVATGPNAAIRMGLGHNALEWLTVRDVVNGQDNINTGLQPLDPGEAYILVAHVASSGSNRGLDILNFGPNSSGQTIEAEVIDSYFFENPAGTSIGLRSGNFSNTGGTVNVRLSGNLIWGQKQGWVIDNSDATNSMVNAFSSGNRFYDNGDGVGILTAITTGTPRADGNTVNFEAHGDQFLANTAATQFDHGGLVILGIENVSRVGGGGSNNTANVELWGCRMSGNAPQDLYAVGARSNHGSVPADPSLSQNNHVTVVIHGDGNGNGRWQPVEFFANSLPGTPDYGNSVTVID